MLTAFALMLGSCTPAPRPPLRRVTADTIVVRTARFAFAMGKKVDVTWPERAEETRSALGASLGLLLDREDTLVPMLTEELGVPLPPDPLDFEVAPAPSGGASSCEDRSLGRRLTLAPGGADPTLFLACVLRRSLARLEDQSATYRAIPADARREELYGCIAGYAVAAAIVATTDDAATKRALEERLGDTCTTRQLDWLGKEWVKRVDGQVTAADVGARASAALAR